MLVIQAVAYEEFVGNRESHVIHGDLPPVIGLVQQSTDPQRQGCGCGGCCASSLK